MQQPLIYIYRTQANAVNQLCFCVYRTQTIARGHEHAQTATFAPGEQLATSCVATCNLQNKKLCPLNMIHALKQPQKPFPYTCISPVACYWMLLSCFTRLRPKSWGCGLIFAGTTAEKTTETLVFISFDAYNISTTTMHFCNDFPYVHMQCSALSTAQPESGRNRDKNSAERPKFAKGPASWFITVLPTRSKRGNHSLSWLLEFLF